MFGRKRRYLVHIGSVMNVELYYAFYNLLEFTNTLRQQLLSKSNHMVVRNVLNVPKEKIYHQRI